MKRLEPLDGLRGLAVLMVLASHASNAGIDLIPPSWLGGLRAAGLGRPGVFLFFVLSSFLLTGQLLGRIDRGEPICWRQFAARRLLRIVPAYALALGILVIAGAMAARPALEHLAFVRAEHHFWTIPVEAAFYLTLPVLVAVLGPLGTRRRRLMALAAAAICLRLAFPPDFTSEPPRYRPNIAPLMPIFLVGSALAVLGGTLTRPAEQGRRALLAAGSLACALLVVLTPSVASLVTGAPMEHTRFHLWFDVFALLWAAVLAGALQSGGWIRAAVSVAPLRWLGQISYSVYLLHALVLGYFVDRGAALGLPLAWTGPAFLAASCLAGAASYWLVERPFLGVLSGRATAGAKGD